MGEMKIIANVQIGKNGLNEGNINTIKNAFNTHKNVKVSILKSAYKDKKELKNLADKIRDKLGNFYTYKIIGHSIFLKKWRRVPKK